MFLNCLVIDTTEMKTTVGERTTPEQDTTTTKNPDLTAITDVTADVTRMSNLRYWQETKRMA